MQKVFQIAGLPDDVSYALIPREELYGIIRPIWKEVFPERTELKPEPVSEERTAARKANSKAFDENNYCLDIVFTEKATNLPIGWIMSEQHDFETFYLRNSGFIPRFRRRQLYSIAHSAIVEYLKDRGFERVVSDHLPNNKAMLLLKIKDGYLINNITLDDRFGPLVRLIKFLHPDRQTFFEKRFRLITYE